MVRRKFLVDVATPGKRDIYLFVPAFIFDVVSRSTPSGGATGWPAAGLVLTAAVPTAANALLMVLEVGVVADLAADYVFWTTVASCFTITGWLVVIRIVLPF